MLKLMSNEYVRFYDDDKRVVDSVAVMLEREVSRH